MVTTYRHQPGLSFFTLVYMGQKRGLSFMPFHTSVVQKGHTVFMNKSICLASIINH